MKRLVLVAALIAQSIAPSAGIRAQDRSGSDTRNTSAGIGSSPHREAGISELLKAAAELAAVGARDRPGAVAAALAATKAALADAQDNLGYPYPPPSAPQAEAHGTSTADHRANALRALMAASDSLRAAMPPSRAASAANMRNIAQIDTAIAALTGVPVQPAAPTAADGRARGGRAASPRRELAISDLLSVIAELAAIDTKDQPGAVATALGAAKKALDDARVNLGYSYPSADSPPLVPAVGSAAAHRARAVQSLTTALEHLGQANPSRGGAAQAAMTRCISEINEALAALGSG